MAARVGSDKWLFFTTLLLIVVGLAMVFSASAVVAQERYHSEFAYVGRQAGWALAGVMAMLVLMNIDTSFYNSPKVIFPAAGSGRRFCWYLGLPVSRLTQYAPMDQVWRAIHISAVGDCETRAGVVSGVVFGDASRSDAGLETDDSESHRHAGGVYAADREAA